MNGLSTTAIAAFHQITTIGQTVCASLWRASWQAGLAVLAIWAVCRAFPRLPASTRCWLWRFTLLKFVVTLLLPLAAISLPVLRTVNTVDAPAISASTARPAAGIGASLSGAPHPSMPGTSPLLSQGARPSGAGVGTTAKAAAADALATAVLVARERALQRGDAFGTTGAGAAAILTQIPRATHVPVAHGSDVQLGRLAGALSPLLFALYIAGVAVCLVRLTRCGLRTRRFLRVRRRPIDDSQIVQDAVSLCRHLGIKRLPMLLEAPDVQASQLVAAFPPVVLLPKLRQGHKTPGMSEHETYRLMLAHELAHLRRGDLWWGGFAALTHTLFFFHPLLWLARREEELTREMACDAQVLSTTAAAPSRYGALLIEAAAPRRHSPSVDRGARIAVASLGFADEIALVRQRLIALQAAGSPLSTGRLRLLMGTAGMAAFLALVPWRLAAARGQESNGRLPSAIALNALPAVEAVRGAVDGRVSLLPDNESGANCVVHLDPIDGRGPLKINHAATDVEGRYRFEGVPAGEYRLWVQPNTRMSDGNAAAVPDKSSLHIRIGQSRQAIHQDLLLTKNTVSIIGLVVDRRTGQLVDDVEVGAGTVTGGPESVVVWQPIPRAYRGYHLHVLPGSVALYVRYGHYKPVVFAGIDFGTDPANPYRLLPADTARVNRVVQAVAGHAVCADLLVDAHYLPKSAPSDSLAPITGHVVGVDGRSAAAGVEVYFFNFLRNDSEQRFPASPAIVRTDAQGRFRLEGIPLNWAGDRVYIRARDKREAGGLSPRLLVTLPKKRAAAAALAPLTLQLASDTGIDIIGQAVDGAGHPEAYVPVSLSCMTWKKEPVNFDEATVTDAQGRYRFRQLWQNLGGWLLSEPDDSHLGNLIEWNQHLKRVGQQGFLPPLVLKPTTQQVAGVVVTPEGKPVPRHNVLLFSTDPGNCGGGEAETDAQGRFRVDHLGVGSYEVLSGADKSPKTVWVRSGDTHLRLIAKPSLRTKPAVNPAAKTSTTNP